MFGLESRILLRNLNINVTKGTTPTTLGYDFVRKGINFIRVENLSERGEIIGELMQIDEECNQALNRSILMEEDVLFSIAGTLGKCALVRKQLLPANTNQALAVVRAQMKNICAVFLLYALQSDDVKLQIKEMQKGMNRQNLSLENIKDLQIPNVSLNKQNEFAAYVESVDKLRFDTEEKIKELKKEKEQLIDKYFR